MEWFDIVHPPVRMPEFINSFMGVAPPDGTVQYFMETCSYNPWLQGQSGSCAISFFGI